MKTKLFYLIAILSLLAFGGAPLAAADETEDAAQQEIEEQEQQLDEQADASEDGRKNVENKIKDEFGVDDARISTLREKDFGYGEIKTTLALAQRMDGGINDENIQKIVDLRTGENKTGWGKIAKQFDVKVGDLHKNLSHSASKIKDNPAVTRNLPKGNANHSPKGPKNK